MVGVITWPHSHYLHLHRHRPLRSPISTNHRLTAPSLHPRRHSLLSRSSSPDSPVSSSSSVDDPGFQIEIDKVGGKRNCRKISSSIIIDADLDTVWRVLTDYEGLASFIPSLAVSEVLDRQDKFAKLYQVGEQNLPLGITFNAKGVLHCYEGDLQVTDFARTREIQFQMVEGDFELFQGTWSIQQLTESVEEFETTLSYEVEVEPKAWLPVRLLEGRLCREVVSNLQCIREEAQRVGQMGNGGSFDLKLRVIEDDIKEIGMLTFTKLFQPTRSLQFGRASHLDDF